MGSGGRAGPGGEIGKIAIEVGGMTPDEIAIEVGG
jgi:hypothetical protein